MPMADLSDNTNWSELDASNNKNSPNGWPEGMMPSGVNDSARNDKGALKRFWDRANPVQTITPASGLWTFTTGNAAYPTAYVDGEIYSFKAGAASAAGDQFQVNALGAKPIQKLSGGSWVAIAVGDIASALYPRLIYSASLNAGAGAFVLTNPYVPSQGDGSGGISVPGNITATGNVSAPQITSSGASNYLGFTDRTTGALWTWYATGGVAYLYQGANKISVDTGGSLTTIGDLTVGGGGGIHYSTFTGGGSDVAAHGFRFGWTGANLVVSVDGTSGIQLANTTQLANYLPLTGGTLSGGLGINGNFSATGTGAFNGQLTLNATGLALNVNGDINTGHALTAATLSVSGGSTLNGVNVTGGGITTTGVQCNGGMDVTQGFHCHSVGTVDGVFTAGSIASVSGALTVSGPGINVQQVNCHNVLPTADNTYLCGLNGGQAWAVVASYAYATASDAALKTDIADLPDCLDLLAAINPQRYRWRVGPDTARTHWGFVAQDVEAAMAAAGHEFGGHSVENGRHSLAYNELIATLWKATQQLAARVSALEAK
jgi:hypothetical protein